MTLSVVSIGIIFTLNLVLDYILGRLSGTSSQIQALTAQAAREGVSTLMLYGVLLGAVMLLVVVVYFSLLFSAKQALKSVKSASNPT
jgi:hypothetical protein